MYVMCNHSLTVVFSSFILLTNALTAKGGQRVKFQRGERTREEPDAKVENVVIHFPFALGIHSNYSLMPPNNEGERDPSTTTLNVGRVPGSSVLANR